MSYLNFIPPGDKSVEYLGMLFGNVGTLLLGSGPTLIGDLFRIFNITVMALGAIVVSYTIILSTINTAQEGDVMGKKWSSLWIPLRCAVGMTFLLPSASGYSSIQILFMKIILMGVGAADKIWTVALHSLLAPPEARQKIIDSKNVDTLTAGLLEGMICAQAFNHDPICQPGSTHHAFPFVKDNKLYIGVPDDPSLYNVCGVFTPAAPPENIEETSWIAGNLTALEHAAKDLEGTASLIYEYSDPLQWQSSTPILSSTAHTLERELLHSGIWITPGDNSQEKSDENGWLFAGSFYFDFAQAYHRKVTYNVPDYQIQVSKNIGQTAQTQLARYRARVYDFLALKNHTSEKMPTNTSTLSDVKGVAEPIRDAFKSFLQTLLSTKIDPTSLFSSVTELTTQDDDPITSLREWGGVIMTGTNRLLMLVVSIALLAITTTCSGFMSIFGACSAITTVLSFALPLLLVIVGLLWTAGITLALYIPLIPYLVFTFTALTWFVLVIEAMVAAPVVSLGIVSPAVEVLGKASPAITLIASVFLRPTLMIIGFILSIQLVRATVTMINYSFNQTIEFLTSQDIFWGGGGMFGYIVLICLYSGFVIAVIHECFSLIYLLPEKIIRWIGHSAEPSTVKASVQETRERLEKGGELTKSIVSKYGDRFIEVFQKKLKTCKQPEVQMGSGTPPNPSQEPTTS